MSTINLECQQQTWDVSSKPMTSISELRMFWATDRSTSLVIYNSHRLTRRGKLYRSARTMIPTESPSSMGEWSVYMYSSTARNTSVDTSRILTWQTNSDLVMGRQKWTVSAAYLYYIIPGQCWPFDSSRTPCIDFQELKYSLLHFTLSMWWWIDIYFIRDSFWKWDSKHGLHESTPCRYNGLVRVHFIT